MHDMPEAGHFAQIRRKDPDRARLPGISCATFSAFRQW